MNCCYLIYPHQIFEKVLYQSKVKTAVLVEEPLYFTQFAFHQKKLMFHRATMKAFEAVLKKAGFKTLYIESQTIKKTEDIALILKKEKISKVHLFDLVDDWLDSRVKKACFEENIEVIEEESPSFYLTTSDVKQEFFGRHKFNMATFYVKQRKRFKILVDGLEPVFGKWSFDEENRKKLPKNIHLPEKPKENDSPFVKEANEYVKKHFSTHFGERSHFFYPITHESAKKWCLAFFKEKFANYGPYQDSISKDQSLLFHSILSPLLNVGLLTPDFVVNEALNYAKENHISINSLEGFIRQIIGWREFVRGVYVAIGRTMRTRNFFKHQQKLPSSFWKGNSGLLPIDNIISKVNETGYANHIERLMIMSNFMLLSEIDPNEAYRWFMEVFIDAYDWVMVPNVYGMGLYADGGMITTKPYISGSNYLLKLSDFEKGNWVQVWNALYWNFVFKKQDFLRKNPRLGMMVSLMEKMDPKVLKEYRRIADKIIHS